MPDDQGDPAFVPDGDAQPAGDDGPATPVIITLGHSIRGDVVWQPSIRSSPHCFIMGIPGQGKSVTTLRILNELARQDVPALVIDFHGQFGDPQGSYARLTRGSIINAAQGLPFSPFELDASQQDSDQQQAQSYAIAEIIAKITGLGLRQQDDLYQAIRSAYAIRPNPTPADVLRILERQEQARRGDGVIARCRAILEMRLFRPNTSDGRDGPRFIEALRSGMVLDLHELRIEQVQLAAGAFALRSILRDMFHWGNADRIRLAIVLDEAHRLGNDPSLLKLMKEGRKYGIAVIIATQSLNDIDQDVLSNTGTRILFRSNYPESQKLSRYIRVQGIDVRERIEGLGVGQAFVQTPDMPQGMVCQMYRE